MNGTVVVSLYIRQSFFTAEFLPILEMNILCIDRLNLQLFTFMKE